MFHAFNRFAFNALDNIEREGGNLVWNREAFNVSAFNAYSIPDNVYTVSAVGGSRLLGTFNVDLPGLGNVVNEPFTIISSGNRIQRGPFAVTQPAKYRLGRVVYEFVTSGNHIRFSRPTVKAQGAAQLFNTINLNTPGCHGVSEGFVINSDGGFALSYDPFTFDAPGNHTISYESFSIVVEGQAVYGFDPFVVNAAGKHGIQDTYNLTGNGKHRVAGDFDSYRLYRGVDGPVDFSAPWQEFDALPFDTPALGFDATYNFVLRAVNDYGLESKNIDEWTIILDSNGDLVENSPSAPSSFSVIPTLAGAVLVSAVYPYENDGNEQADTYLVYLKGNGDPIDPEVDTPIEVTMSKVDGVARLSYTSSAYTNGETVTALVRTRRGTFDSTNTTTKQTTADTTGPDQPTGGIFH